jgi:transposase
MAQPVTVGLDIAKNVFHAYGVDAQGEKALSRKLRHTQVEAFFARLEPCLVGIEACATAHHWARTIEKLGHRVRLMPPAYVKPYVKTQKNDEVDAEAICEAVTRPNMRFAEVKTIEQQSVLVLHRTRTMLIKHRTRMGNTIRAHLAEFGITETIGREGLYRLIDMILSGEDDRITEVTRRAMMCLVDQYRLLQDQILDLDRQVMAWHKSNEASKRLATIPGIGPLAASALVASVADASTFKRCAPKADVTCCTTSTSELLPQLPSRSARPCCRSPPRKTVVGQNLPVATSQECPIFTRRRTCCFN